MIRVTIPAPIQKRVAMKPFDQWSLWKRATFWNVCVAVGVYLGFVWSRAKVTPNVRGYIIVFFMAFANILYLSVRPRIVAERDAGRPRPNSWRVLFEVLAERPFITVLLLLQLVRVSQAVAATIYFLQGPTDAFVRNTPNAESIVPYFHLTGWFMASVGVIWLLSAIGLWRSNSWAWWLAVVLNGYNVVLQLSNLHKFSLDPLSGIAVVVLLLPQVRMEFRRVRAGIEQIAK
jgi:uncharacterized membrane protein